MKLLFELSKEHDTLPTDEIFSCLKAEDIDYYVVDSNENVLVIESDTNYNKIKRLAKRLSFTFFIDELLFSCPSSIDDIKQCAEVIPIEKNKSIAINYKNRSNNIDSQQIVKTLAEIYTKGKTVNLENPDIDVRVLITDSNVYVGLKIAEINRTQFEKRKVQYRPFFSPISLHPKLARTLVNLSCIKKDEKLLDPFCGTGGILLEAGLIGAWVIGVDIEDKMIDGCEKTLDFYKIKKYELLCSDIGEIDNYISDIDAVVTDMPYGKSTTTKGEDIIRLYDRAFESISKVLKENGMAIIGLSNIDMISIGEKYLSLLKKHDFRVHGSLTRHFVVYKK